VSSMSAADAWQQSGRPGDRSYPSARSPRVQPDTHGDRGPRRRPDLPPLPSSRAADRSVRSDRARAARRPSYDDSGEFARPAVPHRSEDPARGARRTEGGAGRDARGAAAPRGAAPASRRSPVAEAGGGRLRGILVVLGVFLVTLAGAAADSFMGIGLNTVTLAALVAASAVGTLLVRRRDIVSVVVSPPLIFVAVAVVDIALAPSATFSLPTMATLLIQGFPAMGIATGVALVIALFRLAGRRR
jgi:NADH:ubiquinone oxidoreductase subunit K